MKHCSLVGSNSRSRTSAARSKVALFFLSTLRFYPQFEAVYEERYQQRYGFWRPAIATAVEKFLACGDLQQGFARVRCPECAHEFFVAFSCRGRCLCPSCHQKRALQTAHWIAQEVCAPVGGGPSPRPSLGPTASGGMTFIQGGESGVPAPDSDAAAGNLGLPSILKNLNCDSDNPPGQGPVRIPPLDGLPPPPKGGIRFSWTPAVAKKADLVARALDS